jgi:hypothetical protein
MSVTFNTSQPIEWLTVDTVTRILLCTPQRVLELIQDGLLSARNVHGEPRISSSSLDAYSATKPLFGRPGPRTFVRSGPGRFVEEI